MVLGAKDNSVDVSPLVAASIARWIAVTTEWRSVYEDEGFTVLDASPPDDYGLATGW